MQETRPRPKASSIRPSAGWHGWRNFLTGKWCGADLLSLGETQPLLHLRDRKVVPMAVEVFRGGIRPAVHPVQIQRAAQVIDLVLQDARIPAVGRNGSR